MSVYEFVHECRSFQSQRVSDAALSSCGCFALIWPPQGKKKKKTVCLFRQACFEAQVSLKVIVINNPPALASKHWGYRCVIIFS